VTGDVARESLWNLIPLTAFLSVTIGLINLFPIPILDGSLIVLALIESIRRKPLSATQKEWIFKIGLAMIITLMLFATYNDIFRFKKIRDDTNSKHSDRTIQHGFD
jgi:regulator of sigma E protease